MSCNYSLNLKRATDLPIQFIFLRCAYTSLFSLILNVTSFFFQNLLDELLFVDDLYQLPSLFLFAYSQQILGCFIRKNKQANSLKYYDYLGYSKHQVPICVCGIVRCDFEHGVRNNAAEKNSEANIELGVGSECPCDFGWGEFSDHHWRDDSEEPCSQPLAKAAKNEHRKDRQVYQAANDEAKGVGHQHIGPDLPYIYLREYLLRKKELANAPKSPPRGTQPFNMPSVRPLSRSMIYICLRVSVGICVMHMRQQPKWKRDAAIPHAISDIFNFDLQVASFVFNFCLSQCDDDDDSINGSSVLIYEFKLIKFWYKEHYFNKDFHIWG